jgi:hypothetical protein
MMESAGCFPVNCCSSMMIDVRRLIWSQLHADEAIAKDLNSRAERKIAYHLLHVHLFDAISSEFTIYSTHRC